MQKIFISYVANNGEGSSSTFALALTEFLSDRGYPVYCYEEAEGARNFSEEIMETLKLSPILVTVINRSYFNSAWCFVEYQLFRCRENAGEDGLLPIYLERHPAVHAGANSWQTDLLDDINQLFDRYPKLRELLSNLQGQEKIHQQVREWRNHFKDKIRPYFEVTSGRDRGVLPKSGLHNLLSKDFESFPPSSGTSSRYGKLFYLEINPWNTSEFTRNLIAVSAMSSFALRMDRYYDGGWGHSFGDLFYHDEDKNFLPQGRYENNVIVLDALSNILSADEIALEYRDAVCRNPRNFEWAPADAFDRKPRVIRLGLALRTPSAFSGQAVLIGEELADELKALSEERDVSRWRLIPPAHECITDPVLLLDFYSGLVEGGRSKDFKNLLVNYCISKRLDVHYAADLLNEMSGENQSRVSRLSRGIEGRLEQLQQMFGNQRLIDQKLALVNFDLLCDFLPHRQSNVIPFIGADSRKAFWLLYRESLLNLYFLVLLTRFREGRDLLWQWARNIWVGRGYFRQDLEVLQALLDLVKGDGDAKKDKVISGRLFVLATVAVLVLSRLCQDFRIRNEDKDVSEASVQRVFNEWFGQSTVVLGKWLGVVVDQHQSGAQLTWDSTGWASQLLALESIVEVKDLSDLRSNETRVPRLQSAWKHGKRVMLQREGVLGLGNALPIQNG